MMHGFFRVLSGVFLFSFMLGQSAVAGDKKDIYFVVWDTTRVDHISAYGYERETTPNLDAIERILGEKRTERFGPAFLDVLQQAG